MGNPAFKITVMGSASGKPTVLHQILFEDGFRYTVSREVPAQSEVASVILEDVSRALEAHELHLSMAQSKTGTPPGSQVGK